MRFLLTIFISACIIFTGLLGEFFFYPTYKQIESINKGKALSDRNSHCSKNLDQDTINVKSECIIRLLLMSSRNGTSKSVEDKFIAGGSKQCAFSQDARHYCCQKSLEKENQKIKWREKGLWYFYNFQLLLSKSAEFR